MVYLGFGGSQETAFKEVLIPAFQAQYPGISVNYVVGTGLEHLTRLQAQKDNPQADVAGGNAISHLVASQQGLFAKLDPQIVTNLADLYPSAPYPDGIGTAISYLGLGISYNTDVFAEKGWAPPTSWKDLVDPKYKGHVYGTDCSFSYTAYWGQILAKAFGKDEYDTAARDEAWRQIQPNLAALLPGPAQMQAAMTAGDAWITWTGSFETNAIAKTGVPVKFVYPSEGGAMFKNTINVVEGAPHPQAAQAFLNFLLSAEAQKTLAEGQLFGPARPDVYEGMPADLQALVPGPDEITGGALYLIDVPWLNDHLQDTTRSCQSILQP